MPCRRQQRQRGEKLASGSREPRAWGYSVRMRDGQGWGGRWSSGGPELSVVLPEAVGSLQRVLARERLWRKAGRVEAEGRDH